MVIESPIEVATSLRNHGLVANGSRYREKPSQLMLRQRLRRSRPKGRNVSLR